MSDIYSGLDTDDLVTGEAVTLELPPASLGIRLLSGLQDLIIELVLLFVGALLVGSLAIDQALASVGYIVTFVGALIVFPAVLETATRGKSIGKYVLGTRTVRDDAGPISFHHAFIRSLVGVVEVLVLSGVPTLISALVSSKGKRLGDYVAGTYVVRDRIGLTLPPAVQMPPELASWARNADITPLPEGLAVSIRQLLGRAGTLSPHARHTLVLDVAERTMPYVAPPPPRGTTPDMFLAAVQAERRARDAHRLHREADLRRRLAQRGR
ncbi:MAG: RDD family protein [Actinomycetota bacterium]|nr:RDD family protein [Actinomycetota bacterium]